MSVQVRNSIVALVWSLLTGAAGVSHAAELALSNTPLFLGGNVEPNVYFVVDDSGSMDEEWIVAGGIEDFLRDYKYLLPIKANGSDWEGVDDFVNQSVFPTDEAFKAATGLDSLMWRLRSASYNLMYYNPNIEYRPWAGTRADGSPYPDATATAAVVHPSSQDMDLDGNPESAAELTIDLTVATGTFGNDAPIGHSDLEYEGESNRYAESIFPATYYLWNDENGDGNYDFDEGVKIEIRPENAPFTNTAEGGRADCADGNSCSYAEEIQNFANWFVYHRKRSFAALAAMASSIDNLSGVRLGIHLFNRTDPLNTPVSLTDPDEKTNALRMVHDLPLRCVSYSSGETDAGVAYPAVRECRGTPARQGLYELGALFESADASPILSAAAGGACQQNFGIVVTDGYWNATNFGDNDSDTGFPAPGIDDNDSDGNTDFDDDAEGGFADGVALTLADVAMHFYERDLSDLDNIVPNSARDGGVDLSGELPPVALDDASHQRMNTYTIAFGVDGYELDPFGETTAESDTWPTADGFVWTDVRDLTLSPAERERTRVDDLFHAAYNGRGLFLSANDPTKLTSKLEQVLEDIADRSSKSGASVALTSGRLNESTLLFQARFDPLTWNGQLLAVPVESDGRPSDTLKFEAGCRLTGGECPTLVVCAVEAEGCAETAPTTTHTGQPWDSGRTILTWRPADTLAGVDGHGIRFAWPVDPATPAVNELSPGQIAFLKWNPATGAGDLADATGEARLQHLRGRQDLTELRNRDSLLGDIVSSAPIYVAAPSFAYPDGLEPGAEAYSAFAADNATRTPMVYVGANDGMLHGFNASSVDGDTNSGREELAYIPSSVYRNLWRLTAKGYGTTLGHRFFVNGSPAIGDALFDDGTWHTVLVGTLGQGGQGAFALDVTDPASFSESGTGPSETVLWEFTDIDDADLGYTYGKAHIVRLHNGQWAAIVSNGYNNIENDTAFGGQQSTTGNGVLYLLNVETGELIKKFDTGHGTADDPETLNRPNGLAEPTPIDLDGDRITDYIYVPDLFGNVFKIDVRGADTSAWDFTPAGGTKKTPLYTAKDSGGKHQPITSRVEVGLHPFEPGTMIFFGTGKFIETTDGPNVDVQSFYGLWDRFNGAAIFSGNREDRLLSQEIIEELTDTFALPEGADAETNTEELRLTTTKLVDWGAQDGWYMDLVLVPESGTSTPVGERVVANPILRGGRIIFVITDPSGDPCAGGGDSWLAELSASDGARLPISPFDLNEDGLFDVKDLAGVGEGGDVASMVKLDEITVSSPGILEDGSSGIGGSGGTVGREYKYFSGSESGQLDYLTESSGRLKGRQSWRQIWSN